MANIPKLWAKTIGGGRGFVISHVKAIYYDWKNKKLLKDKLDEMDKATEGKVAKSDIKNVDSTSTSDVPSSSYVHSLLTKIDAIQTTVPNFIVYSGKKQYENEASLLSEISNISAKSTPYLDIRTVKVSTAGTTAFKTTRVYVVLTFLNGADWQAQIAFTYTSGAGILMLTRSKYNGTWKDWKITESA